MTATFDRTFVMNQTTLSRNGTAAVSRRTEANQKLVGELRTLQADLRAMLERFEVRTGGVLNELIAHIEGDDTLGQPPRPVSIRTVDTMMERIGDTRIRRKKARGKDLARLEKLVRKLTEMVKEA